MIFDPDQPLEGQLTERQSLIKTARGWAVMGQPTSEAEVRFKAMRTELAAMCPDADADLAASAMAFGLHRMGAF